MPRFKGVVPAREELPELVWIVSWPERLETYPGVTSKISTNWILPKQYQRMSTFKYFSKRISLQYNCDTWQIHSDSPGGKPGVINQRCSTFDGLSTVLFPVLLLDWNSICDASCFTFSPMRSEGFSFNFEGLEVGVVFAQRCFFVRKWSSSRPQTFATVRNEVAKPPMGSAQKVSVVWRVGGRFPGK